MVAYDDLFVVDFDNHYYECKDTFTRYIDEEFRPHTINFRTGRNFENYMIVDGEPCVAFREWAPPHDRTGVEDFFASMEQERSDAGATRPRRTAEWFSLVPEAWRARSARLELMNEQGVHSAPLFSTAGMLWHEQVADKPDVAHAINRAFNRWVEDEWGYNYANRIFGVPELLLLDVDQALDEVNRLLDRGARALNMHVGPVGGHSPASTRFDPIWRRIEEAGVVVAFHLASSPYSNVMGSLWGEDLCNWRDEHTHWNAFHWFTTWGDRPIMDTLVSFVYWNLFGRFPGIRVASVENGSGAWVEYTLRKINRMAILGRHGPWPGGRLDEKPADVFRRHVYIVPFPEDDLGKLLAVYPAERVLFGSDFPHPEGMPEPMTIMERLRGVGDGVVRRIVGLNGADLLQLSGRERAALMAAPAIRKRAKVLSVME